MAVTNRVANATKNFLFPKLVEGVVTGNKVTAMFLKKAKGWAGAQIEIPFKHATNSNGGSFIGLDTLSTAAVDNTIKLTFEAKFTYQNVTLPKTDLALNDTPEQVANLLERQVSSDTYDLALKIATQLYSDGTGNSSKDITGLAAAVDDGTSAATYGGQTRATYTQLNSTVTASSGTLTLAKMYTLFDACAQGSEEPNKILTTKAVRSFYNQLLTPSERYTNPDAMGTGASKLMFRGAPVEADTACTSGVMFMLNEDSFDYYAIKKYPNGEAINYAPEMMDGEPDPSVPKGAGFFFGGWTTPTNQEAVIAKIVHGGNLICKNPRYNGKLTGITGI